MAFLEQFFFGNVDPQSRERFHPKTMRKMQQTISSLEQALMEQLPTPQKELFVQYIDSWGNLNVQSELDSFVYGFRMGAQMALDTFVPAEKEER
ncbi:DUF6809 family protein [uncultured Flavonifractor sp.]|uniref:DUF6809 family protein n=1 Tax=uncultured Flavonifractor sp. TaxID=1193534 RepID=UPI00260B3BE5|nr:DUF6809 family protein [uncultured Flavonifractor sp.]